MASILESLSWQSQTDSTALQQLGVNNRIYQRQLESQRYFTIKDNAQATDGNALAIRLIEPFSLTDNHHLSYLSGCTTLFKEKLETLQALDQKIVFSTILSMVATSLSFIPFVGYFSLLGSSSALYHIHKRSVAEVEYRESLNLLVANCNWSLGNTCDTTLINRPEIRDMMSALYPVLTEKQVQHLIADEIEEAFKQELHHYEEKYRLINHTNYFFSSNSNDERIAQSKRSAEFKRCVYGYNKGNPSDYLDAFLSVLPDLYHATLHGFRRLQHWWDIEASSNEVAQSHH